MRRFPNMVVMAPGDGQELGPMLDFALGFDGPVSIRYPKANVETVERAVAPIELGRAEVIDWGTDGTFIAFGALLGRCVEAARQLREEGLDVGVINARFAKPLDAETILRAVEQTGFVLTVEESTVVRRLRLGRAGSGRGGRRRTAATFAAWAFPTASSSTANGTNCWPTSVSTSAASSPPPGLWPTGRRSSTTESGTRRVPSRRSLRGFLSYRESSGRSGSPPTAKDRLPSIGGIDTIPRTSVPTGSLMIRHSLS